MKDRGRKKTDFAKIGEHVGKIVESCSMVVAAVCASVEELN